MIICLSEDWNISMKLPTAEIHPELCFILSSPSVFSTQHFVRTQARLCKGQMCELNWQITEPSRCHMCTDKEENTSTLGLKKQLVTSHQHVATDHSTVQYWLFVPPLTKTTRGAPVIGCQAWFVIFILVVGRLCWRRHLYHNLRGNQKKDKHDNRLSEENFVSLQRDQTAASFCCRLI